MIDHYEGKHFVFSPGGNQETVVHIATRILFENGMQDVQGIQQVEGVWIYPREYFCPMDITTMRLHLTKNSRTIHHYAGTWISGRRAILMKLKYMLPEGVQRWLGKLKHRSK